NDSSGYGNSGTTSSANGTGMDCMVQGKYGSACEFDGVDDYVDLGSDKILSTGAWTLNFWFNLKDADAIYHFASSDYAGLSRYLSTLYNRLRFYNGSGVYETSNTDFELNKWNQGVYVYDGIGTVTFYLNGRLDGSASAGYTGSATYMRSHYIGADHAAARRYFNGSIDDVRIYNYARTAEQIQMDYNAGVGTHFR
ncbi:MAG: LamG domain-containing protein, partial [Candidatus Pacebacteria bacterium]|nr:LamG domain-containing protein [Candidatus Paceibacterota bacterium]